MKSTQRPAKESLSSHAQTSSSHSYDLLMRISEKLGRSATRSLVEVKSFLAQEIILTPLERFMKGMPRIKLVDRKGQQAHSQEVSDRVSYENKKKIERGYEALDSAANLRQVVEQSHEVLATANTIFPVTLFPDTVFVDRTKVTIIRRSFFWSEDVLSIRIEDVLNVSASVGPLFGSLTIASRVMSTTDHFQINHFWRNDAIHLKHIIQGYVIAQHNNLDTTNLTKEELTHTLMELGHDSTGQRL